MKRETNAFTSQQVLSMLKVTFDLIKWEYKVVAIKTQVHASHFEADRKPTIDDVQNDLNELGDKGWELAGVQDITLQDGRGFTIAYLKRQKD